MIDTSEQLSPTGTMEKRTNQPRVFQSSLPVIMEKVSANRVPRVQHRFGWYLTREDIDYLQRNTNYSAKDIKIWFRYISYSENSWMIDLFDCRNFKKECPNGILDKGKVQKIYKQKLLPHSDSKFLVDQLFRIIDDDNNGGIDFKVSQPPRPDPVESMR